jgi:hypothetical protein
MRRPSPALVVAVIALIVAMSGTSYAVTQLPRNSVGAKQLKRNAVTAVKIKKNAVTAAKIRNNAVTGAKVKDGSLSSRDFAAGTLLQGPKGDTGATGPSGPSVSAWSLGIPTGGATIPAVPANVIVAALGSDASGSGTYPRTGTLTVNRPSRLTINGSVTINLVDTLTTPAADYASCFVEYRATSASTWDGPWQVDNYAARDDVNSAGATLITVPIVAFVDVEAGEYDVRIGCLRTPDISGTVTIAGFSVVATDR